MKLILKRSFSSEHCATILGDKIMINPPLIPEITRQKIYQASEKPAKAQLIKLNIPAKADA